ncbi:hypothetical protein BGZ73_008175 [Actinomortierella ambigua]|nr:hypothetical protein BGZ73_008175 [Actinomortierella ambigua]
MDESSLHPCEGLHKGSFHVTCTAFAGNCGAGDYGYCMSASTCRREGGRAIDGHCPVAGATTCCVW